MRARALPPAAIRDAIPKTKGREYRGAGVPDKRYLRMGCMRGAHGREDSNHSGPPDDANRSTVHSRTVPQRFGWQWFQRTVSLQTSLRK